MDESLYPKPRHDRPHNFKDDDFLRAYCAFCGERRGHPVHDPDEKARFFDRWRRETQK